MSNTVITKEKQSLKALRKENGTDNKAPVFAKASTGRPTFTKASTGRPVFAKVRVDKSTGRPAFAKASTGRPAFAKASDFVGIHIHEGRIIISDYSENDDRNPVLAILGALGLEPEVETESWCG
jgi:hypothetical protein